MNNEPKMEHVVLPICAKIACRIVLSSQNVLVESPRGLNLSFNPIFMVDEFTRGVRKMINEANDGETEET